MIDAGEDTYPDTSAAYAPAASRPYMSAAAAAYAVTDDNSNTTYDTQDAPAAVPGLLDRKVRLDGLMQRMK